MTPKRIQRKRTKGYKLTTDNPNGVIYVGRPTKYGNGFKVGDPDLLEPNRLMTAEDAVKYYEWSLAYAPQEMIDEWRAELRGKDLACWCKIYDNNGLRIPCHADVLLKMANS